MDHPGELQVRAPQQERSRRTLRRILAAGWAILEEKGPDGLTVAAITSRARTSVGSFYARFGGKEDLLRYMAEEALREAEEGWDRILEGLPALAPPAGTSSGGWPGSEGEPHRELLSAMVGALLALHLDGPAGRVARLDGVDDPAPTRRRRLEDRLAEAFPAITGREGDRGELAARILGIVLHEAAARAGDGASSPLTGRTRLEAELVELLVSYLGSTAPPVETRGGVGGAAETEAAAEPAAEPEPILPPEPILQSEPQADLGPEPEVEPQPEPDPEPEPDPFDIWG